MWTIDAQCARCRHKAGCIDRTEIIRTLSPLANKLNTDDVHVDCPGDGVLVVVCRDFLAA